LLDGHLPNDRRAGPPSLVHQNADVQHKIRGAPRHARMVRNRVERAAQILMLTDVPTDVIEGLAG
jgi:hypothetical protein